MLSNTNAKHADHILGAHWKYADHKDRATLPIGVKDGRERRKILGVPRAAAAYGWRLKSVWNDSRYSKSYFLYKSQRFVPFFQLLQNQYKIDIYMFQ